MPLPNRKVAFLVAGAFVLALLIGLLPMWSRARTLDRDLSRSSHELTLSRLQGRLGAAMTEAMRSNYERSRQLMAEFFSELQSVRPALVDRERQSAADEILAQRDEIITLLSRAEPESVQRLMLLYTRWYTAVDPRARADAARTSTAPP